MRAPGLGRILLSPDGSELLCDPKPGSPEWTTLLAAQALPLAATLRGWRCCTRPGGGRLRGGAVRRPAGRRQVLAGGRPAFPRGRAVQRRPVALEFHDGALLAHPGAALLHLRPAEHKRLSAGARGARRTPTFPQSAVSARASASPARSGGCSCWSAPPRPPLERIEAVDPLRCSRAPSTCPCARPSACCATSTWPSRWRPPSASTGCASSPGSTPRGLPAPCASSCRSAERCSRWGGASARWS